MTTEPWTVDDHLRDQPEQSVALFRRFEELVRECGPFEVSPSKTTVTFKGTRRGFAGVREAYAVGAGEHLR